jgi:hypothetical protein
MVSYNKQIIVDLMEPAWGYAVIRKLKTIVDETPDSEAKKILEQWIETFKPKSTSEILDILKEESNKPDSVLRMGHSYWKGYSYWKELIDSSPHTKIETIINEGEEILRSRADRGAKKLCYKWDSRNPDNPCLYLFRNDFFAETINPQSLGTESDYLRIYIISHAAFNSDYLYGGRYHIDDVSNALAKWIGTQQTVVNIISCSAGADLSPNLAEDKGYNSFAAKLHAALYSKMKRDIPVVARNQTVHLWSKKYTGAGDFIFTAHHQQPGSKVIFTVDAQGNQIRLDAYYFRLKNKISLQLQSLIGLDDISHSRKELLQNWLISIETKTPEQILELMTTELNKPDSVLNEKDWDYYLSITDIATAVKDLIENKTVKALIDESKKIIYSPKTINQPVLTGRNFLNSQPDNTSEESPPKVFDIKLKNNK